VGLEGGRCRVLVWLADGAEGEFGRGSVFWMHAWMDD